MDLNTIMQMIQLAGDASRALHGSPAKDLITLQGKYVAGRAIQNGKALTHSLVRKLRATKRKKASLFVNGIDVLADGVRVVCKKHVSGTGPVCQAL